MDELQSRGARSEIVRGKVESDDDAPVCVQVRVHVPGTETVTDVRRARSFALRIQEGSRVAVSVDDRTEVSGGSFEDRGSWTDLSARHPWLLEEGLVMGPHVVAVLTGTVLSARDEVEVEGAATRDPASYRDRRDAPSQIAASAVRDSASTATRRGASRRRDARPSSAPPLVIAAALSGMAVLALTRGSATADALAVGWLSLGAAMCWVGARRWLGHAHVGPSPLRLRWLPQPRDITAERIERGSCPRGTWVSFVVGLGAMFHALLVAAAADSFWRGEANTMEVIAALLAAGLATALGLDEWLATRRAASLATEIGRAGGPWETLEGELQSGALCTEVRIQTVAEGVGRGRVTVERRHESMEATSHIALAGDARQIAVEGATWLGLRWQLERDGEDRFLRVSAVEGDAVRVLHLPKLGLRARGPETLIIVSGATPKSAAAALRRGRLARLWGLCAGPIGVAAVLGTWLFSPN